MPKFFERVRVSTSSPLNPKFRKTSSCVGNRAWIVVSSQPSYCRRSASVFPMMLMCSRGRSSNDAARVRTPEDVPRVSEAVDNMFRNSTQQTKTESEKSFELSFLSFLGNVKVFLLAICSAITFTILLVSGNTIAMSVRERVREVGILKTLGFTQGAILGLILAEAMVIAAMGGIVGLLIAKALIYMMRQGPNIGADMTRLVIPPSIMVVCLGVAILIGLLSAFFPAWNASRKSIVEALRFAD